MGLEAEPKPDEPNLVDLLNAAAQLDGQALPSEEAIRLEDVEAPSLEDAAILDHVGAALKERLDQTQE